MGQRRYRAFLSYSHRDKATAEWLHCKLETYRLPKGFGDPEDRSGFKPIFKDRDELPASTDLGDAIETALAASDAMIVLCSPSAAISPWIAKEIDLFKRHHGDRAIFLAVIEGEPPYNIPPPLLVHYEDGQPTEELAEPVAADLRPEADGRKLGLRKLVAGLAQVELDALINREAQRRHRHLAVVSAFSLLGMVGAIALALFAIQQRDAARAERAEANGLIEYMLTDLRKELEPMGRLDLLEGVGERAMDYYSGQNLDSLTPEELGRRARAIQLVAEMNNLRGDNDKALPAFRQAARTTGELLARDPRNPQKMFNHGQSLYWVGYIAWQRGQMAEAKRALGEYADISHRLAARDRDNLDWQMEEAYALSNLGTLASDEGRFPEALALFEQSVAITERVVRAEHRPPSRLVELGEGLSWVASTQQQLGDLDSSAKTRRGELALYAEVLKAEPGNADAKRAAMFAQARTGWLLSVTGKTGDARRSLDQAIATAVTLLRTDPDHTLTLEMAYQAYSDRAMLNWREGRQAAATRDFDEDSRLLEDLRRRDLKNEAWNVQRPASLALERALTDQSGMTAGAMHTLARSWIARLDPRKDKHVWPLIAAHILNAIAYAREGRRGEAARAYARAIAIDDVGSGINVNALALRALAAERLGQTALAAGLRRELVKRGVDPGIVDHIATG